MICPNCGYSLDDGVAFCIYCGTRFGKYADDEEIEGTATPSEAEGGEATQAMHAAETPDGEAVTSTGEAVPESAWQLVGDYPQQVAGADAGQGAEAAAGAAAVGAAGAADAAGAVGPYTAAALNDMPEATPIHAEDAFAQRMPEKEPNKGRKGLGAVIAGVALAAGIAAGAAYVVPNMVNGDSSGSSSASSSASGSASASSSGAASSSADGSSSSTEAAAPETRRGSTLSNATSAEEQAAAEGEGGENGEGVDAGANAVQGVDDSGQTYYDSSEYANGGGYTSGNSNWGAYSGGVDAGAYNGDPYYTTFSGAWASATSVSPTEGSVTHGADLVLDGRADTAWNTNLSGVDESITINSNAAATVSGLRIMNGYNKISSSGTDLYWANSRAKTILVEYEGGSFEYTLADEPGKYQDIIFNSPVWTSWIKITIKSEYVGGLYEDCCISEIQVY